MDGSHAGAATLSFSPSASALSGDDDVPDGGRHAHSPVSGSAAGSGSSGGGGGGRGELLSPVGSDVSGHGGPRGCMRDTPKALATALRRSVRNPYFWSVRGGAPRGVSTHRWLGGLRLVRFTSSPSPRTLSQNVVYMVYASIILVIDFREETYVHDEDSGSKLAHEEARLDTLYARRCC
jgi:hypothetical protein